MNNKAVKWGTKRHKIQMYLPSEIQVAFDRYITEKYSPEARVVTATITRALSEFLEKEGYLGRRGLKIMEVKNEVR